MTTKAKTQIRQLKFIVPIIIEPDSVGFHAYSPALKGLHASGETEKEALKNARDTAADFIEIMVADGIPIPLSILSTVGLKKMPKVQGYFTEEIVINYH